MEPITLVRVKRKRHESAAESLVIEEHASSSAHLEEHLAAALSLSRRKRYRRVETLTIDEVRDTLTSSRLVRNIRSRTIQPLTLTDSVERVRALRYKQISTRRRDAVWGQEGLVLYDLQQVTDAAETIVVASSPAQPIVQSPPPPTTTSTKKHKPPSRNARNPDYAPLPHGLLSPEHQEDEYVYDVYVVAADGQDDEMDESCVIHVETNPTWDELDGNPDSDHDEEDSNAENYIGNEYPESSESWTGDEDAFEDFDEGGGGEMNDDAWGREVRRANRHHVEAIYNPEEEYYNEGGEEEEGRGGG